MLVDDGARLHPLPQRVLARIRHALGQRVRLVEVDDAEVLVDVAGQVALADGSPDQVARHHPGVAGNRRIREFAHDIGALEAPLLAEHLVVVVHLGRVGIGDVLRIRVARRIAVLVHGQAGDRGVATALVLGDRVPDRLEPLERGRDGSVVRVEGQEQLTARLGDRDVGRAMVPAIGVADVADREVRLGLPALDELLRAVGRLVVDDQPLEIPERLLLQTAVWSVQGARPIAGPRVDREGVSMVRVVASHGSPCPPGRSRSADILPRAWSDAGRRR